MAWLLLHRYGELHKRRVRVNMAQVLFYQQSGGAGQGTYIDFGADSINVVESPNQIDAMLREAERP